jgi:nucleolar protein 14
LLLFCAAALGEKERCWPSTGTLLLLKLQSLLFSVTDYRHVIVTPTLLLLGQCLTHCPVNTLADLRAGLFCAGLMIDVCSKAKRYAPESERA